MITEAPPKPPADTPPPPAPQRRGPSVPRNLLAIVVASAIVLAGAALMYFGIRAAYGGFDDVYFVETSFPRASQLLQQGSDVRLRGVRIGEVSEIELAGREVKITLEIEEQFRIPSEAEAVISLKTLLGAKFIDLRVDRFSGPYLEDGQAIERSHVGPELEDALADGVSVLEAINPADLATVIHELAVGARGHGEDVARGLAANSDLSDLFADTLAPQLQAIHDFRVVFGALESKGVDLNRLADALNEGVPVYASAEAQAELDRALEALVPFADNLADLLILNRADWDRMFDHGDTVLATIAVRPESLRDLVTGLASYVERLGGQPPILPNGTAEAPFANFIGGTDADETRNIICGALPEDVREGAPLCTGAPPIPLPHP